MIFLQILILTGLVLMNNAQDYDNTICASQFSFLISSFPAETWATEVLDSWGKLPSGILSGNIVSLGDYDECVNVNEVSTSIEKSFKGQYCLAAIDLTAILPESLLFYTKFTSSQIKSVALRNNNFSRLDPSIARYISPNLGICVPSSCSPKFIVELLKNEIGLPILSISESSCYQNVETVFSGLDIFVICFFSLFGLMMVASTLYDIFKFSRNEPRNPNLIAFSIYTNGEKLFKCNRNNSADVMDCLHGIRFLSMVWILFAHTYEMQLMTPQVNMTAILTWPQNAFSMILLVANIAVDTFLLLSGLLVAWSVLRQLDKTKGRLNIPLMYFHRYIRLTPSLLAGILFTMSLGEHIATGPFKYIFTIASNNCKESWWQNLLYVQNYVNKDHMCFGHSWYLAVDMQLFVLSPIIIYPLWRWRNKFIWVIPLLTVLSMACTFTIFMLFGYFVTLNDPQSGDRNRKTYLVTHTRIGPYMVGIFLAYILHRWKGKTITLSKPIVICGWIFSLGTIFSITFGLLALYQPDHVATPLEAAFYEPFSRVGWAIGLSWIIYACVNGYGGPINWLLSLPQWQPLGRLSYSIYIIHVPIQYLLLATRRTTSHFADITTIHSFWGDFGFTLSIVIFWVMAFESPILTLEKLLLGRSTPSSKSNKDLLKAEEILPKSELDA